MEMNKGTVLIFIDGKYQQCSAPELAEYEPGRLAGTGVFETLRLYQQTVLFWPDHWRRWQRGRKRLGLGLHISERQIKTRIVQTIRKNRLSDGRLRLMQWRNQQERHWAIVPGLPSVSDNVDGGGLRACLVTVRRPCSPYSHLKTLRYQCFRLSLLEARAQGYAEGILLNHKNEVVESSRGNIFYYAKGVLRTPHIKSGCLSGTTRRQVMVLARGCGLACAPSRTYAPNLMQAEEVFITNALKGLVPVVSISGQPIGKGVAGPVTQMLRRAYLQEIENYCLSLGDKIL